MTNNLRINLKAVYIYVLSNGECFVYNERMNSSTKVLLKYIDLLLIMASIRKSPLIVYL